MLCTRHVYRKYTLESIFPSDLGTMLCTRPIFHLYRCMIAYWTETSAHLLNYPSMKLDTITFTRWQHITCQEWRMTVSVVVFTHYTGVTSYEREVCSRYTSALCSPSRLSLGTALVWSRPIFHLYSCMIAYWTETPAHLLNYPSMR